MWKVKTSAEFFLTRRDLKKNKGIWDRFEAWSMILGLRWVSGRIMGSWIIQDPNENSMFSSNPSISWDPILGSKYPTSMTPLKIGFPSRVQSFSSIVQDLMSDFLISSLSRPFWGHREVTAAADHDFRIRRKILISVESKKSKIGPFWAILDNN